MSEIKWHHESVLDDDNSWVIFYFHEGTSDEYVEAYTPVTSQDEVVDLYALGELHLVFAGPDLA